MGILGFAPIHLHERINDKVLHFGTFCILSVFLYYLWNLSFRRNLILTTIILFALTIGSEFIQGLLPYRSFDWYDILANILGSFCGLMLAFLMDYLWTARKAQLGRSGGKQIALEQQALMMDDLDDEDLHRMV
ncbi:uncharacterized protein BX664DRAFT_316372 [Halteromyces radiatus]|uniref:uncharacterized protein n=1 Tax=Halteromyces radiatus TaxID=101107 RepID=UPI00221F9B5D|nr:uncharacterized protein BX664DRAFT_316372 [Halteromyces radiatus]KAI8084847.1 hypothetical protein BX664DRAFT_316372 [Halteromyces radiatus]